MDTNVACRWGRGRSSVSAGLTFLLRRAAAPLCWTPGEQECQGMEETFRNPKLRRGARI